MTNDQPPILDFDPDTSAIIEPSAIHHRIEGLPERCVITWMGDAFARLEDKQDLTQRYMFDIETSSTPVYEMSVDGEKILVTMATVGAPASAALLETLISLGCTTFVAIGSSGGLVPEHAPGTVVFPDSAIRDEGTSYHYLPAGQPAVLDAELQTHLASHFAEAGFGIARGTAWTTDAFYRETSAKVDKRVGQGAIAVDMEAASLAAVAEFRNVRLGHALYLADTLHSHQWDPTDLIERNTDYRYDLLLTATRACAAI